MPRRFGKIAGPLFLLLLAPLIVGASAQENHKLIYIVSAGAEDYPICQILVNHLNKMPPLPSSFAEFPAISADPDFSKPDWKDVDVMEHKDVVAALIAFGERSGNWDGYHTALIKFTSNIDQIMAGEIKDYQARMQVAEFKIDNSAVRKVYRYYRRFWSPPLWREGWSYYVPQESPERSYYYNRRINFGGTNYQTTNDLKWHYSFETYDALIYKGQTFLLHGDLTEVYWPRMSQLNLSLGRPTSRKQDSRICMFDVKIQGE